MNPTTAYRLSALLAAVVVLLARAPSPRADAGGAVELRGAACSNEPLRRRGTTHYVCACDAGAAPACVPGDDSNAGKSMSAPLRTVAAARARFAAMAAGDTVALCRGGSWADVASPGRWENGRCTADGTCDVRDYTPPWAHGGEAPPRLSLRGGVDLFSVARSSGVRISNLEVSGGRWAFVTWDRVDHLDVCNVTVTGSEIGFYVAVSRPDVHHITLRESRIVRSKGQGFLGACDACAVDGNYFGDNGSDAGHRDHNVYVGQNPLPDGSYHVNAGMRVTNNELTGSSSAARAPCSAVELTVHGSHRGLLIENNFIHEQPGSPAGTCYGISVGSGRDVVARFPGLVVRRNRVFNVGNVGIEIAEAPDAVVEDNLVVGTGGVRDAFNGIRVGEPCSAAPAGSACLVRAVVRNNTVFAGPGAHGGKGVAIGTEGTGHVVTGNVVVSASDEAEEAWRCYDNDLPPASYALLDGNACWLVAGGVGRGAGTNLLGAKRSPLPLAALFNGAAVDPRTADFTPASGSPLLRAGNDATTCTVGSVASQPCSSPSAMGSVAWSPDDPGKRRSSSPPTIGAFDR